ncbi:glycine-rich protein 1-like [Hemicordylus capensis]|uniref:glycine-rich protein 1-like n=1 Tax=Hemicordylus capensis TaxID=884348 RepID=UPI002302FD0C|nr:glycine-rich protein 1-like [Hemicordylus capensis]
MPPLRPSRRGGGAGSRTAGGRTRGAPTSRLLGASSNQGSPSDFCAGASAGEPRGGNRLLRSARQLGASEAATKPAGAAPASPPSRAPLPARAAAAARSASAGMHDSSRQPSPAQEASSPRLSSPAAAAAQTSPAAEGAVFQRWSLSQAYLVMLPVVKPGTSFMQSGLPATKLRPHFHHKAPWD